MERAALRRPRLLWLVLGAMLLVSVLPLGLYHRQVLQLSQEKLTDTESVQQTEVTRVGRRRNRTLRRQPLPATHQRTPNPRANRSARSRGRSRQSAAGHAPARKFRRQQSQHSLPHRRQQRRQGLRRRQFSAPIRTPLSAKNCSARFRRARSRCSFAAIRWRSVPTTARPL